jgi:hypothetical protein
VSQAAFAPTGPEQGQGKLQERQLARLLENLVQDAVRQPVLDAHAHARRRLLDDLAQLLARHITQVQVGVVQGVGHRSVGEGLALEVRPQGQQERYRPRPLPTGQPQKLVQEPLPHFRAFGGGVQFLGLVEHQEQAEAGRVLGQDVADDIFRREVSSGQRVAEVAGLLKALPLAQPPFQEGN